MNCSKCGSAIDNVPEHLRDLATWICQKCTNTAVKPAQAVGQVEESMDREIAGGRRRKAA